MAGEFDEFYADKKGGMKNCGLGENIGKDDLARKNVIAVNEKLKLEHEARVVLEAKVVGLVETVTMMQIKMTEMEVANNMLRAQVYQAQ